MKSLFLSPSLVKFLSDCPPTSWAFCTSTCSTLSCSPRYPPRIAYFSHLLHLSEIAYKITKKKYSTSFQAKGLSTSFRHSILSYSFNNLLWCPFICVLICKIRIVFVHNFCRFKFVSNELHMSWLTFFHSITSWLLWLSFTCVLINSHVHEIDDNIISDAPSPIPILYLWMNHHKFSAFFVRKLNANDLQKIHIPNKPRDYKR